MSGGASLDRKDHHALLACDQAAEFLKAMGFKKVRTSMTSESCYYALDGCDGTIRVAAHRYRQYETVNLGFPVLALVTFGSNQGPIAPKAVEDRVAVALGYYFWRRLDPEFRIIRGSNHPVRVVP